MSLFYMSLSICDTDYWKIYLSEDQYCLGRCVIVLKRNCGELSRLTEEEFFDLLKIVKRFEVGVKKEFGANMFNWTCLMNNAWKETNNEIPQVHFHVRPRYKDKVNFSGVVFEDEVFAHHYKRGTDKKVSEDVAQNIIEKIREIME